MKGAFLAKAPFISSNLQLQILKPWAGTKTKRGKTFSLSSQYTFYVCNPKKEKNMHHHALKKELSPKKTLISTLLCLLLVAAVSLPGSLYAVQDEITVVAVGDCIISHKVSVLKDPGFLELVNIIRQADCTYGNCETTFFNPADGFPGWKNYFDPNVFCLPNGADELKWVGIDIVSLANNHIMDFDYKGLFSTLANLDRTGIAHAGAGKDLARASKAGYIETAGGIVSLVSCCATIAEKSAQATPAHPYLRGKPGLNPLNIEYIVELDEETFRKFHEGWEKILVDLGELEEKDKKDVKDVENIQMFLSELKYKKAKKTKFAPTANKKDLDRIYSDIKVADNNSRIVISSTHEHMGEGLKPTGYERDFAHKCIDSGADMFVGTGPHVLWGLEIYKGKPIFYSLGNFFFHTLQLISADAYERLGLPADTKDPMAFPGKFFKFFKGNMAWESIVPVITYDKENKVKEITLYPIFLEKDVPLHSSGTPRLARGERAIEILERFKKLSAELNTKIVYKKGIGKVIL